MIFAQFLFLVSVVTVAQAEAPAASKSTAQGNVYHLVDLQPVSYSLYPTASVNVNRHYFQFRNQEGNHFIVYEQNDSAAPLNKMQGMIQAMENWNSSWSIDIECQGKPFCTGNCHNMYYQASNGTGTAIEKGRCKVISFTCSKQGETAILPPPETSAGATAPNASAAHQ